MSHLIECPECKKSLQVPDDLIGKKVQCPECKHMFTAQGPEAIGVISSRPSPPPLPPKRPAWEKQTVDDESSDRYDVSKRPRVEDDDDDIDEDRPSRRRSRRRSSNRGNYLPHRGGLILAFGIMAIVVFPIFGPFAWIMGNTDLREIRDGRMDPEGEGMTQTGRILGMVATIIAAVSIIGTLGFFGCFCCFGLFVGMADANRNQNFNRRK